ncbi:hypothetical protein AB205_0211630 [Aquarana catesbeiana]|uniref:Uncharacterized protein n=1 Tax=Aquarana catesbeiana TaxID=8400 RepID=A0A2G9SIE8_AQUCT|nr:hypothetical protein AB205_0211630 [Aquarana catesbeiana]
MVFPALLLAGSGSYTTYFTDDVLQPTVSLQSQSSVSAGQQSGMLLASDLDSSLANLVGNLGFGGTPKRSDMQWNQPTEKKLTGGTNWQARTSTSTTWNTAPVAPVSQVLGQLFFLKKCVDLKFMED